MEPDFADFFAQQAAALENSNQSSAPGEHIINDDDDAQEASEQADFNKWMAEEFGDTDGQELQQQGDLDGGDIAHASAGGYSPSAVQYEHHQRGYSPSAPIIPEEGYSPSNPVIPLQGDEDGSEMQQSRFGSQDPISSLAQQPSQHAPSADQSLQPHQTDSGAVPGVSQFNTTVHQGPGGPISAFSAADSQSSTPVPVPTSPQLPQVVTTSGQPLTPIQAAQARIAKNIHDHEAWKEYLVRAENTADLDTIRDAYEEALKAFPNTASLQIAYLNHYLTPPLFQKAEALFARFLRPSPSVELWKFYLTYVRRINTNTTEPTVRDIVRKAYEFALSHVGHDMESGQIWRDYIDFLKTALDSRTTWDAQQKMDALRNAYHRAVVIPLDNVEALWRELDQYENGLNKITAKKFLQDLSPGYMTAKTALRDLKRLLGPISTPTLSTAVSPSAFSLPPYPIWTNEDRILAGHWKAYLKWEEGNPLVLEDQAALHNRIISAYRKAVARMRFFPDITWLAYHTLASLGKTEEAMATLKQGILSNPSSPVLSFAYAELMETQKNIKEVNDTYNTLIETMHKNLEDLQIEIEEEVAAARATVLHGDITEQDPTTPAVIEAEDRARKTRERRSKDMEAARNELGVVWVMLMRFSRRSEGLRPARAVFARARKDKWCPWVVYEAAALMEYHCTKAADVATKIFEIGLKQFADNIDYVVRYLNFLISINDDNNARALFERTISTFPGEKGRPLWERWSRYEFNFSDLAASQKLEQRMAEALPSTVTNPPIKQFAHKYTYLGIDAIASRDLGAGGRGPTTGPGGKNTEGTPLTPSTTTASNTGIPPNGNANNKRAASPARRRDPSPPPNKRFKGNSPPPLGGRGRDWESGRDRERGKRNFTPPRRDHRRDGDAVPDGVVWFMSTLPSAAAFDGPKFRTDDLMQLLRTANLPTPHAGPGEEDALRRITGRIKDPGVAGAAGDTKIMIIPCPSEIYLCTAYASARLSLKFAMTAPNTSPRLIPPPSPTTFTTFGLKSTDTLAPLPVTTTNNDKMAVDMLSGLLLEDAIVHNAIHKAQNTPDKTFFLGMLAGLWITFGGLAGLSAAGGIPVDVRNNWPILPKLGLAFFFPTALHFIVLFGGELFTGNTMIVVIGWLNKKLTLKKMLLNWFIVYIGNFCGCVLFGYLFGYLTQIFEHEPYLSYVQSIAVSKTHYPWHVIFLKGIVANTCVCLGVILGLASRDAAGKIIALWFPPVIFVLMGMEHVVANQFFVNIGLMYGADTTIGRMWFNQSAAALGNLVGGAIVLGLSEHVMNHWKSPLPWHKDHPRGSLAAHDVESTRKAKESPSQASSSANSIMNMFGGHHGPKIEVTPDADKDNLTLRPPTASHQFNGTVQMV